MNFVAIFAIKDIYISGNIHTDPKHFSTLQVHVNNMKVYTIYMYTVHVCVHVRDFLWSV